MARAGNRLLAVLTLLLAALVAITEAQDQGPGFDDPARASVRPNLFIFTTLLTQYFTMITDRNPDPWRRQQPCP